MMLNPYQRFLGVDDPSNLMELLALVPDNCGAAQIQSALERQLAKVYQHPDASSPDADTVRHRLRTAAQQLLKVGARPQVVNSESFAPPDSTMTGSMVAPALRPAGAGASSGWSSSRRSDSPTIGLTEFDRQVLAVLVACGGWNNESRNRLVALATNHGVTVQGLMRIMSGLGHYARQGGPHVGVADMIGEPAWPVAGGLHRAGHAQTSPALIDRLAGSLATQLQRDTSWMTIKLAAVFGIVTIIAGVVAMVMILKPPATEPNANFSATDKPQSIQPRIDKAKVNPNPDGRMVTYPQPPTFLGNGLPVQAAGAADQYPKLIADLDEYARKISVEHEPGESMYRAWADTIRNISAGWVLAEASVRREADRKLDDVLAAGAATPAVLERLFTSLTPPSPDHLADPIDIWRGTWLAGTLGRLGSLTNMPVPVVERARNLLSVALAAGSTPTPDPSFENSGRAWLDRATIGMTNLLESDPAAYDQWELWLSAQRSLGTGDRFDAAIMAAIERILQSTADVSKSGQTTNVLGRLVSLVMTQPNDLIKQRFLGLFDSRTINSRDLWALTSLVAQSGKVKWFSANLVLPEEADDLHRARVRDSISRIWPSAIDENGSDTSRGLMVDFASAHQWIALCDNILRRPASGSLADLLRLLVLTSRLNEAAENLAGQDLAHATRLMQSLDENPNGDANQQASGGVRGQPQSPNVRSRAAQPGVSNGPDAEFTAKFEQAKSPDEKLNVLRELRISAGSDLGPIDARTIVHEAYRGGVNDVRLVAQAVIIEKFSTGPVVAMEMLDQFVEASMIQSIADVVQGFTDRPLPELGSPSWKADARLALVQRALELQPIQSNETDVLTEELIESYMGRLATVRRGSGGVSVPRSPHEAADMVLQAWHDRAQLTLVSSPAPADMPGLDKRQALRERMADGPVQQFIARQLGLLDLITYITVADQPELREAAVKLLRERGSRRGGMNTAMEQAVEAERAIASMWRLRMATVGQPRAGAEPVATKPVVEEAAK